MKNNTLSGRYCFKNPRFKQIFRIMRISTFLLMVCVFCSYAGNAHSQNAKVSIRMNNVKLDKILNEIENQTDYLFIYNNQVDINKITSVKVKNEAVAQVLDRIIIRKTKCFDFWERNVLFPKTKRSFFRTPKHPLPCPFPLNFSLLIITKKFGNLAKNRYICIV